MFANILARMRTSDSRRLKELEDLVDELQSDVESLLKWRTKTISKWRQRASRDGDEREDSPALGNARPELVAPVADVESQRAEGTLSRQEKLALWRKARGA